MRHTRNIVFKEMYNFSTLKDINHSSHQSNINVQPYDPTTIVNLPTCFICMQPICNSMHIAEWIGECHCYRAHGIHRECIAIWCLKSSSCPLCRSEIIHVNNRFQISSIGKASNVQGRTTIIVNPIIQQVYRFPQRFSDSPSWLYVPLIRAAFNINLNCNDSLIIEAIIPSTVWINIVRAFQIDFTIRNLHATYATGFLSEDYQTFLISSTNDGGGCTLSPQHCQL